MSKWECNLGHALEGLFYVSLPSGDPLQMPEVVECPYCQSKMVLGKTEGAARLLGRIRDVLTDVSKDPGHKLNGSRALADLERLEMAVKKIADEASRP